MQSVDQNVPSDASRQDWDNTHGYELYVGRWSKLISHDFIQWLDPKPQSSWFEIGCGTGALTQVIAEQTNPSLVLAIDPSGPYLQHAREVIASKVVTFMETDLATISLQQKFDHITSGLVLNFLPHMEENLRSTVKHLRAGGTLSSFVWDYAGHYQPMRHFWDAAREVNAIAGKYDAGIKFGTCRKDKLTSLFQSIGLSDVKFTNLERIATFNHFDDYWLPIASAQGSVTEFMNLLSAEEKEQLKGKLKQRLPIAWNGEIKLIINALAVSGKKL